MKKYWWIIAVAAVAIAGITWWALSPKQDANSTKISDQVTPEVVDQTKSETVAVDMKNTAFTPQKIKVKKGTKVTWTNQDSIGHNVVATDPDNTGGLPTEHALLQKGESYSFTFETVGTFDYHCAPHKFMTGIVEVVE